MIDLIGNTPLVEIPSLSKLTGSKILLKCEHKNPGGSVKDRAALSMVKKAIADGRLKPGMTIVEGTAGNTGIGLALVGRALGYKALIVMPNNQAKEKERFIELFGAELKTVPPCPFKDENHFYHTARRIAEEEPEKYWWANQFENTDNGDAHFENTGPEIWQQTNGSLDAIVSVAGTGGTISGCSRFLKSKKPNLKSYLVDPDGSGLYNFFKSGEFKSHGSSMTEGIGIMRLTENFKQAEVDDAWTFPDQDVVTLAHALRDRDGIVLGSSAALNVIGAIRAAAEIGPGKTIVTFWCDGGERSLSKLYNEEFLTEKGLDGNKETLEALVDRLK